MNSNSHQPPDWWGHSSETWANLVDYFCIDEIAIPSCWQKLTNGQSNNNYRLQIAEKTYFVQLVNPHNTALLPLGSHVILEKLYCYQSVKPWLVDCYLNLPSLRIFAWFENIPTKSSRFDYQPFFLSLLEFLAELHSLKLDKSNQVEPQPVIDIQEYLVRYRQLALQSSPQHSQEIQALFCQAANFSQNFEATAICHNDMSLNNLLWSNRHSQLKIVDWEYACYSDPMMDLAGLVLSCQLDKRQENRLIIQYKDRMSTQICLSKLNEMKQLCQIISKLWLFASQLPDNLK